MNDLKLILSFLFKTHRKSIVAFCTLYLIFVGIFYMRYFAWQGGKVSYLFASPQYRVAIGGITFLFFLLSFYLGYFFNSKRPQNMALQIPISTVAHQIAGPMILFSFAVITFFAIFPTWVHAYFGLGQPVTYLLFFQPLLVYSLPRIIRRTWLAVPLCIFPLVFGIIFLRYVNTSTYTLHWFNAEVIVAILTLLLVLLVEQKRWRSTVFLTIAISSALTLSLFTYSKYEPQTFRGTIVKLTFYPYKEVVEQFVRYSTHPELWSHEKAIPGELYIYGDSSNLAYNYLNADQRFELLRGIVSNHGILEFTLSSGNTIAFYPLWSDEVDLRGQNFLLTYYDLKPAFCDLFPTFINKNALEALQKSRCEISPFNRFRDLYSPHRNNEQDKLWEEFLLSAYEKGSTDTKVALSSSISKAAGWNKEDSEFYRNFNGPWLMKRPFTRKELQIWRKSYRQNMLKVVASLSQLSPEEFERRAVSLPQWDEKTDVYRSSVLEYICNRISDNCSHRTHFNWKERLRISLKLFFHSDPDNVYEYDTPIILHILKPENFAKLKTLNHEDQVE